MKLTILLNLIVKLVIETHLNSILIIFKQSKTEIAKYGGYDQNPEILFIIFIFFFVY